MRGFPCGFHISTLTALITHVNVFLLSPGEFNLVLLILSVFFLSRFRSAIDPSLQRLRAQTQVYEVDPLEQGHLSSPRSHLSSCLRPVLASGQISKSYSVNNMNNSGYLMSKGTVCPPKRKNINIYSPSCCSKPVLTQKTLENFKKT